jgi:hypothetical protein
MEDDTFKRILQDKQFHLQIKAEQKEIIQNVLERKDSMAECYGTNGLRKEHVLRPPFLDKVLHHICFSYGYL